MLLALAAVAHHRTTDHEWVAEVAACSSGDRAVDSLGQARATAGDGGECLVCCASHVRYVPAVAAPALAGPRPAYVVRILSPRGDEPVVSVDWLTAPKTSPPA